MVLKKVKESYLHRHILWEMALKQFKAKHAGSMIGVWVAIVNPILIVIAITFVFTVVFKVNIEKFAFFAFSGIFPWVFFSTAVGEASSSLVSHQSLFSQYVFPREFIPLSVVLANFINFLVGWVVVYPLFCAINLTIIQLSPLLLVVLVFNFFLAAGFGLILAVLNVFFRELQQLIGVVFMLWFWLTPIFYSLEMVPKKFLWISWVNPLTHYMIFYRDILFRGKVPSVTVFAMIVFFGVGSLFLGVFFFEKNENNLLKRL